MARMMRTGAGAILAAITSIGAASALPSCGDGFEPPCRVASRDALLPASELVGRSPLGSLAEGSEGEIVVLSMIGDARRGDAGADASDAGSAADSGDAAGAGDGGDAGEGGARPPSDFTAPAVSVVVVAPGGTAARLVHTFPPPSALVARRGGTESVAATFTGDGVLFHWVETTTTTAADGTRTTSAASKRQRVDLDGREGPVVADPDLACTDCKITTLFATLETASVGIVRQDTNDADPLAPKSSTRLVAFDALGRRTASVDLAALLGNDPEAAQVPQGSLGGGGPSAAAGGSSLVVPVQSASLRLQVRGGRLVTMVGRNLVLFDVALTVRGGPWALPTPTAEMDTAQGDIDIAWVGSLSSADAGTAVNVGDLAGLLFESRRASGPPRIAPVRISTTSSVLLVRRNEERVGVLHAAEGTTWFSLVGADGEKRGGDLALSTPGAPALSDLLGPSVSGGGGVSPARSKLLFAVDRTHFVVWSASSGLTREVITCDP